MAWEETDRADTSVTKINSPFSPRGEMGQKCLATGISMAMRLWDEESPAAPRELSRREYETIGIVISSRAPVPLRANGRAWC